MDKIEHPPLSLMPMRALSLRLARSAIKMQHDESWRVDKQNPVHDLVICLTGCGWYRFGDRDEELFLSPGEAMLIPARTRFRGRHGGGTDAFTGVAQHFSLSLFGQDDVIKKMRLRQSVELSDWQTLGPLTRHYRETVPRESTTLTQHHQFMVLLLAYLEDAFEGWMPFADSPENHDQLSLHIMFVASRLSSDPLGASVSKTLEDVPYNPDYFRRAFSARIGMTPQKFRELKRMEFAANRLGAGATVKAVAAELGFSDPYFFSRMFKRYVGASPSSYRDKAVESHAREQAVR